MPSTRLGVLLPLVMLLPMGTLHSQGSQIGLVVPGDRVRLTLPDEGTSGGTSKAVGVLTRASADSLTVRWESGASRTIALSGVRQFEVSDGPQRFVAAGMGYGFLGGALVGGVVGASQEGSEYFGRPVITAATSIVGALGGAVLGGLVGAIGRRERWSAVRMDAPLRRVRLSPSLVGGTVGLRAGIHLQRGGPRAIPDR